MLSSVLTLFSTLSPSQSPLGLACGGVAGAGGAGGPISGERPSDVNALPRRLASTRRRKRVDAGAPFLMNSSDARLDGTVTCSCFSVPMSALTKTALAPSRLKITVSLLRPRRKLWPRIVSVWPIEALIGETDVTTGSLARRVLASATPLRAGTRSAPKAAVRAARRRFGRMRARSSIGPGIGGKP